MSDLFYITLEDFKHLPHVVLHMISFSVIFGPSFLRFALPELKTPCVFVASLTYALCILGVPYIVCGWPEQVVLFEGWMLGFEPQNEAEVTSVDPQVCQWVVPSTLLKLC